MTYHHGQPIEVTATAFDAAKARFQAIVDAAFAEAGLTPQRMRFTPHADGYTFTATLVEMPE